MTDLTLTAITSAAAEVGADVRTDYSGRGMYGATCVGVVTEGYLRDNLVDALAEELAYERGSDEDDADWPDAVEEAREDVEGAMSSDSMGLRAIFYFRGVKA